MRLYKKDSKGKIRILDIWASGEILFQESGLLDGKLVKNQKVCKGKNIGKANETSPEQQAVLEAEAIIKKKLREGYFESVEEAEKSNVILPMLAKEYGKEKHKIDWNNCFVQPKLDGMRAISLGDNNLTSRKNKEIDTLSHLYAEINKLRDFGVDIPDGEVYAHGLSFQENMKLIKKYRAGETEKVKYHIYDCVSSVDFEERYFDICDAFDKNSFAFLSLVPTFQIHSEKELKEYHQKFLSEGYEGTIVRWGVEPYKINGRSSNLLKYKDFKDMACEVIDVFPSEKRPEQGVVVCDGFKANLKFSHKEREEILKNKSQYIGKIAEIRYFEKTDDGYPRFPVCCGFREDK